MLTIVMAAIVDLLELSCRFHDEIPCVKWEDDGS